MHSFPSRCWCKTRGTGSRRVTTYWKPSHSGRSNHRSTGNQVTLRRRLSQRRCWPWSHFRRILMDLSFSYFVCLNSLSSNYFILSHIVNVFIVQKSSKHPISGNHPEIYDLRLSTHDCFLPPRYSWQGGHQHQSNKVHRLPNSGGFHPEPCSLAKPTWISLQSCFMMFHVLWKFSWHPVFDKKNLKRSGSAGTVPEILSLIHW